MTLNGFLRLRVTLITRIVNAAVVQNSIFLLSLFIIVATGDSFPAEKAVPIAKNKIRIKFLQLRSYSS